MNRLSHTFAAFAVRDFRLMWFGSLFSVTAFMTSFILVPSVAYELTGSYLAAGLAQMGAGVAQLLLGPIGGVIADRYPKKPLVLVGQMLPGFLIAGMGILILTDRISIPLLILTTLLMGIGFSVMGPARQAWTGEIVPRRLLANAVALQQMSMNTAQVIGPMLISIALEVFVLKTGHLFLIVASFFAIVLPMTSMIRGTPASVAVAERRSPRVELAAGFRYLVSNPRLRILWLFFLMMVMCGFAFQTLLPGILDREFGRDPFDIGPTYLILGVASLLVNVMLAGLVSGRYAWPALLSMGMIMAVGFWLVAIAPGYGALLVLGAVVGAGRSGVMLVNQSIMMANTRPEYFGRVMSFVMMAFGLQALLGPVWGALADSIGGRETLALVGLIAATSTVLMGLGWLRTRKLPVAVGTAAEVGTEEVVSPQEEPERMPPAPVPAFAARVAPVVLMDGQKAGAASGPGG